MVHCRSHWRRLGLDIKSGWHLPCGLCTYIHVWDGDIYQSFIHFNLPVKCMISDTSTYHLCKVFRGSYLRYNPPTGATVSPSRQSNFKKEISKKNVSKKHFKTQFKKYSNTTNKISTKKSHSQRDLSSLRPSSLFSACNLRIYFYCRCHRRLSK